MVTHSKIKVRFIVTFLDGSKKWSRDANLNDSLVAKKDAQAFCVFFLSFWRTHVLFGATGTPVLDFW